MTILFFSRLFYPHIGGVEKHVFEISKILVSRGYKVVVVSEKHEKSLKNKEKIEGIEVYRIPNLKEGWFKKFKIWKWMLTHKDLIRNADIVHCHDVFFWYFPFLFLFPKKKVYTTFHGYENYPVSKKAIAVRRISEKLSKGTICVGSFMKKWYGTRPDSITYGGVNIDQSEKRKATLRLRSGRASEKSAMFIGRLDEQTGIEMYLKASKLIKKKIPNFKFLVIGDGKFGKNIGKDVDVLGFQKDAEKYFEGHRFAFVSRYLSILEAMAAKRLVFAIYDNILKKDYLKMTPFAKFINISKNPKELSDSVLYFLKYPDKENLLINNGFEWVKSQNWEKVAKIYINLWKK